MNPSRPPSRPSLPRGVILRDVIIFHVKLWLDGLKDVVLAPVSVGAAVFDLIFGPSSRGYRFYRVLHVGERIDLWLNLYAPVEAAEKSGEGLFGGSEPGDGTLVGDLEGLGRRPEPRPRRG